MLKKFKNETLFGRTKWLYFCFIFVYFYQFLSGFIKEKDFLVASFVYFYQPKKLQATDQTLRAACRQRHTNEHFSRLRAGIPSAGNFFSFYSFTRHHTSRRQPANTTTPATSFLTEQISASRSPTTFTFTNPLQLSFLPPSNLPISSSLHHPTLSINLPPKKLSLRLSFSHCI